jgi:hypothetical protein
MNQRQLNQQTLEFVNFYNSPEIKEKTRSFIQTTLDGWKNCTNPNFALRVQEGNWLEKMFCPITKTDFATNPNNVGKKTMSVVDYLTLQARAFHYGSQEEISDEGSEIIETWNSTIDNIGNGTIVLQYTPELQPNKVLGYKWSIIEEGEVKDAPNNTKVLSKNGFLIVKNYFEIVNELKDGDQEPPLSDIITYLNMMIEEENVPAKEPEQVVSEQEVNVQ